MSNEPSADTDPWDRPLDVSGETRLAFTGAHANHRTSGKRPAPQAVKLLHPRAQFPMTGTKHRPRRKTTRGYGTTRASFSFSRNPSTLCPGAELSFLSACRNKKVPMPQVVVTSSRMGSAVSSVVPPPSAFQPPIRILKRSAAPTQTCPSDDSSTSASPETLAERTARYNATRERIFGGTTQVGAVRSREDLPVSAIIRDPKGPERVQGPNGQYKEGSQGFGARAGKRGSPGQKQAQQLQPSDPITEP